MDMANRWLAIPGGDLVRSDLSMFPFSQFPMLATQMADKLLRLLEREGRVVATSQGLYFHIEAMERLDGLLAPFVGSEKPMSVPEFKKLTGTSRKHAIPLLEYLDRLRVTRRVGDARLVVRSRTDT